LPARNPTQPVPLAQGLLARGTGDAYGAELLVRLRAWHGLSGQLGYTLSRAERRDVDAPTRLFDFDQTHVLSVLAAYAAAGFIVSSRVRLASGSPRTPVVGAYRDLADDRFEPVFGAHNGIRLPAFFALDLRIERVFVQRAFSWSIALDVSNVTNRRNVEDIAYRFDYRAREDIIGLPTLAVLGWSLRL
ncbi:MAG: ligand-gated channel protein, partial [Polyangiales bacterium]